MAVKMADLAAVMVDLLMAGFKSFVRLQRSLRILKMSRAGDQVANVTVTRWPMVW